MPTPYADLTKELIAAIQGAPDPYNILLARVAIAIAKLQQWQDAAKKREARVAELEAELAAIKKHDAVVAWASEIIWHPNPRWQSEQLIKVTRKKQEEYGFVNPICHTSGAQPPTPTEPTT